MTCVPHPNYYSEVVVSCTLLETSDLNPDEKMYTATSKFYIKKQVAEDFVALQQNIKAAEEARDSQAILDAANAVLAGNPL